VSIGYAEKNTRLMQELGLDEYCQNIETLDAATLLEQIRRARQEADHLAVQIGAGTRDHDARVRSLLDDVAHRVLGLPRAGTGNPL
jgi:polysaccharide pyruvyl transferase WcaK-like protein